VIAGFPAPTTFHTNFLCGFYFAVEDYEIDAGNQNEPGNDAEYLHNLILPPAGCPQT
jgi:hypothetical protein